MERVPVLVALDGPLQDQRFRVTPEGLDLGRGVENSVVIAADGVSRLHARVLLHNGAAWVHDSGSRNGVFVNDKRVVRPRTLAPGDRLSVGPQVFTIEVEVLDEPSGLISASDLALHAAAPSPVPPEDPPAPTGGMGKVLLGAAVVGLGLVALLVAAGLLLAL